jgi:uncharacterized protein YprB with RNaseH-like and TPR domain
MSLFPFTVKADDDHGGVPTGFYQIFQKNRTDATWYAADVIVHSFTEIEFVVFDMATNGLSRIGDEIYRVTATVTAKETEFVISHEAIRAADREIQAEMRQEHLLKVNARAYKLMVASGLDIEDEET